MTDLLLNESVWKKRIHEPFLRAALIIALTFGFGYAIILIELIGHQISYGAGWMSLAQAHGHAQLFGWLGLFVIGMGLFFLPRLANAQLQKTNRAPLGFWLLVIGIALRGISQPLLGWDASFAIVARVAWLLSALMELAGAVVIGSMLAATHATLPKVTRDSPAFPVIPFLWMALASFAFAFLANFFATLDAFMQSATVLSGAWDALIITLILYGVAIPMALVFSVRNLPLFLRLALPPRDSLRALAAVYALGFGLRLASTFNYLFAAPAAMLQSAVILIFVWQLDLIRLRPAWITKRAPSPRPNLDDLRKPTRANYPDAGEYGRFELLIYSAYAWLVFFALIELGRGVSALIGFDFSVSTDAERHALTLGFITLLIFGMAVRLAPGFSGKNRVAHPRLVAATFFLGNLAALLRVAPLFLADAGVPLLLVAPSGAFGWIAVAGLAWNLFKTFRGDQL
ncbi:MAG: NnrS family protein [Chloroflexi bacterium]|nr:NnrS family protein [Chloroflexota bacterium]